MGNDNFSLHKHISSFTEEKREYFSSNPKSNWREKLTIPVTGFIIIARLTSPNKKAVRHALMVEWGSSPPHPTTNNF